MSYAPQHWSAFPCHDLDESGISAIQYAAIHLRVPTSGTDWLDDMIRQSLRTEVATKAMQGLIASPRPPLVNDPLVITNEDYAVAAILCTDALLAEIDKGWPSDRISNQE